MSTAYAFTNLQKNTLIKKLKELTKAREIRLIITVTNLSSIGSEKARAAQATNKAVNHLLEYLANYTNDGITYRSIIMILAATPTRHTSMKLVPVAVQGRTSSDRKMTLSPATMALSCPCTKLSTWSCPQHLKRNYPDSSLPPRQWYLSDKHSKK